MSDRSIFVLVQAVAELVHAGEDRLEPGDLVVRRQADVLRAALGGERVRGLVEPPLVVGEPEGVEDRPLDLLLPLDREAAERADPSTASSCSAICATSGTRPPFSSSKMARTSAVFMSGS